MDKVISNIVSELSNENYIIVAVIVVCTIVFNLNAIANFFDARKKVKINLINDALGNDNVTGATKKYLENLVEFEYFHKITGVAAEKDIREKLIEAYESTHGKIRFSHFKRSVPYINFYNDQINIEIGWFSKIAFAYNIISAFCNFIGVVLLLSLIYFQTEVVVVDIYQGLMALTVMFLLGMFFLSQSLPVVSSYYVKKHLEKSRETDES